MNTSLVLEKLFSRSSFYDIACFSILTSGPQVSVAIFSEGLLLMLLLLIVDPFVDVSHVLEDFFSRFKIPPIF